MTDAEKMRAAAAQWCADEADRCEDAAKWGGHRKYVQDCKAAAFALRNAWSKISALPLPEPTEALVAAAPYMATVQNADPGRCLNPFDDLIAALGFNENQSTEALVAAERALWVQAIEIYFDATAVMDVEKHVERLRAEGRRGEGGEMMEQHGVWLMMEGWNALIAEAQAEAGRAMMKYPQPNYVISKIAEEAGEVVKSAIHCAEGRDVPENVRGEMIQLIAMLYRLWAEGDQVHGLSPVQWWIKGEGQL